MKVKVPYYKITREEINLVAVLYHALFIKDNLKRFLNLIKSKFDSRDENCSIYMEYSYIRDYWYTLSTNKEKIKFILDTLNPENKDELLLLSIENFNSLFVSNPRKANFNKNILSPGSWHLSQISENISDNKEFLRFCKFKWAFNAKPDLVIEFKNNMAVCIEAKFESKESRYPKTSKGKSFLKGV